MNAETWTERDETMYRRLCDDHVIPDAPTEPIPVIRPRFSVLRALSRLVLVLVVLGLCWVPIVVVIGLIAEALR